MTSRCSIALLESALTGNLPADDEASLQRHLEECEACSAEMERMAGGAAWCQEAASLLIGDELDDAVAGRDEWSGVDFTVEHLEPSDEPNVLGRLGGYDVLEIIGRGGMGVVLKGYDRELKRCVAIKVLAPHLAHSSLAKKRFAREAQAAAAVVHPHVLAIHQVQPSGRLPFLVMPLVAGESLAQRLAARGTLELKEILRIGMQAAAGLAAAHEQGLVHRDVKPANILLEKGIERAVLTDFGLARAADDVAMTRWGIIAGTPQYMSPEQARGEPLDGRSDLFSLGCVLYEMATGVSPFRTDSTMATMRRLVEESPQAMASLNPELPPWFIAIIDRLLQKEPSKRFGSAKEVSELLEGCLAHVQQPAGAPLPAGIPASSDHRSLLSRIFRHRGVIAMSALGISLLSVLLLQSADPDAAAVNVLAAASSGDLAKLQQLVEADSKLVEASDANKMTPLHLAVQAGRAEIASFLLKKGADPNAVNSQNRTPLELAVLGGRPQMVKLLVTKGADVNVNAGKAATPLHTAVSGGNRQLVELLLAQGAQVNAKDQYGSTALHTATSANLTDLAALLIEHKADLAAKDTNGRTPIELAVLSGRPQIVKLLAANGADVNVNAGKAATPLHTAVSRGEKHLVELLLDHGAQVNAADQQGNTALHAATSANLTDLVTLLIEHKADPAAKDTYGRSPLELAVLSGRPQMVKLLVTKGADVNVNAGKGVTPLHTAVSRGDKQLVELLLAQGAQVNAKDQYGSTALHTATSANLTDLAMLLIEHKADLAAKDTNGRTPLELAVLSGRPQMVKLLVTNGADVNVNAGKAVTPLHTAVSGGNRQIVELLLANGAQANAKDQAGNTPLFVAASSGQKELAALLLDKGADPHLKNVYENTPIAAAKAAGYAEVVELLEHGPAKRAK